MILLPIDERQIYPDFASTEFTTLPVAFAMDPLLNMDL